MNFQRGPREPLPKALPWRFTSVLTSVRDEALKWIHLSANRWSKRQRIIGMSMLFSRLQSNGRNTGNNMDTCLAKKKAQFVHSQREGPRNRRRQSSVSTRNPMALFRRSLRLSLRSRCVHMQNHMPATWQNSSKKKTKQILYWTTIAVAVLPREWRCHVFTSPTKRAATNYGRLTFLWCAPLPLDYNYSNEVLTSEQSCGQRHNVAVGIVTMTPMWTTVVSDNLFTSSG